MPVAHVRESGERCDPKSTGLRLPELLSQGESQPELRAQNRLLGDL